MNTNASHLHAGPIIVGSCLSCMESVRVPQSVDVNSIVRCPRCKETFLLADMLERTVPALEVLPQTSSATMKDDDVPYVDTVHLKQQQRAQRPEPERTRFEIPKALRDGAKRRRRRRSRSSSSKSDVSESSGSSIGISLPGVESTSSSPTSAAHRGSSGTSSSRKSQSGSKRSRSFSSSYRSGRESQSDRIDYSFAEMIKIGLGALLAFPIAYLVLMWVIRIDPLYIGAAVGKVVPFAVPESIRTGEKQELESLLPPSVMRPTSEEPADRPSLSEQDLTAPLPEIDPKEIFGL